MKLRLFIYLALFFFAIFGLIFSVSYRQYRKEASFWQGKYFEEVKVKESILENRK